MCERRRCDTVVATTMMISKAFARLGVVTGLMLALGACGTHGTKVKDGGIDRPDSAGDVGAGGAAGGDAAPAGAGGDSGAGGSAGGAAGVDGVDGGAAGAGDGAAGADAGAGGAINTCGTAGAGGAAGAGACAVGKAECGGAAGDCETNVATDVMNCGRCGRACGAGSTCAGGLCSATVILAPTVNANWCDAVFSATKAYMVTCWGTILSEVRAAPLEPGGDVTGTRIISYAGVPVVALRGIIIDGDSVYYGLEASPSHLWKFPLDATGPTDVTSAATFEDATRFDGLQLVGDTYYWNHNTHTVAGQVAPGSIQKRAKTGATSTTLVAGLGGNYNLIVTPTQLFWLEVRTMGATEALYRAPLAGAAVADVKKVGDAVGSYAVKQGDYVYWTNKLAAPAGKVSRIKIGDDAALPEDVSTCLNLPEGLVADASYVYFKQLDALYRAPLGGGPAEQLSPVVPAHDVQTTRIFHVDDKYVYFGAGPTSGASTLVRVAK
jgi:hypothetical protein